MKGGAFLSTIQTAFHQLCLIGPSVGAAGNRQDENITNGLKLMLPSLTREIYSTSAKSFCSGRFWPSFWPVFSVSHNQSSPVLKTQSDHVFSCLNSVASVF